MEALDFLESQPKRLSAEDFLGQSAEDFLGEGAISPWKKAKGYYDMTVKAPVRMAAKTAAGVIGFVPSYLSGQMMATFQETANKFRDPGDRVDPVAEAEILQQYIGEFFNLDTYEKPVLALREKLKEKVKGGILEKPVKALFKPSELLLGPTEYEEKSLGKLEHFLEKTVHVPGKIARKYTTPALGEAAGYMTEETITAATYLLLFAGGKKGISSLGRGPQIATPKMVKGLENLKKIRKQWQQKDLAEKIKAKRSEAQQRIIMERVKVPGQPLAHLKRMEETLRAESNKSLDFSFEEMKNLDSMLQQQMYERLFGNSQSIRQLEADIIKEGKAKGKKITPKDLDGIIQRFVERHAEKDIEFQKDWEIQKRLKMEMAERSGQIKPGEIEDFLVKGVPRETMGAREVPVAPVAEKPFEGLPEIQKKPAYKVKPASAVDFRTYVKALGGVNPKDPGWHGELADISGRGKWQPGVKNAKGHSMDDLVATIKEQRDGWGDIIKDGNDVINALARNTKRSEFDINLTIDEYAREYGAYMEERYGHEGQGERLRETENNADKFVAEEANRAFDEARRKAANENVPIDPATLKEWDEFMAALNSREPYKIEPKPAAGALKEGDMINGVTFKQFGNLIEKGDTTNIIKEINTMKTEKMDITDVVHPSKIEARLYQKYRQEGLKHKEAHLKATEIVLKNYNYIWDRIAQEKKQPTIKDKLTSEQQRQVYEDTLGVIEERTGKSLTFKEEPKTIEDYAREFDEPGTTLSMMGSQSAYDLIMKDLPVLIGNAKRLGKPFKKYLAELKVPKEAIAMVLKEVKARGLEEKKKKPEAVPIELPARTPAQEIQDAKKVTEMYERAEALSKSTGKFTLKGLKQKLARLTIDTSANVKNALLKLSGGEGKEATIRHDLRRGASAKSAMEIEIAEKKIYKDNKISMQDETLLNRVIQSRRTLGITKYRGDVLHPEGLTYEHASFLNNLKRNEPENFKRLNKVADQCFKVMENQLDKLLKDGLITKEGYNDLISKGEYSLRQFIDKIDPDRKYNFQGASVPDSGIKKLGAGSENLLENNFRLLMGEVVSRTNSRIFHNRANLELWDLANKFPDNGIVRIAEPASYTKDGKPIWQKAPAGYEKISVMVEGKHRELIMPRELAKEWVLYDPAINAELANAIQWISGNKILKPMATGLNPEFALTNFPRDIVHSWFVTETYSPHVPVAAVQIGKQLFATRKDALLKKGDYVDYINDGGGMPFLTHQGRITAKGAGAFSTMQDVAGFAGEFSELWVRLALRKQEIQNGKTPIQATWEARNYLDFAQGGQWIKAMDNGVPYLNAGVQGTRGIFRAFKNNPAIASYKTAQLMTMASSLYLWNRVVNPECFRQVSDHEKRNNYIITTPWTYKDEAGNTRYRYFKIAKDQGQRFFATMAETLMAKYMGDEIDVTQITKSIQDAIPMLPVDFMPPSLDAFIGYGQNQDFWRNEDIWKGPKVESKEEFTRYTHPGFVKAGEFTGLSPERIRYFLSQYVTSGNIYTSLVGGGTRVLFDQLGVKQREMTMDEINRNIPFLRKIAGVTNPAAPYREKLKKLKMEFDTKAWVKSRDLDILAEDYYKDKKPENYSKVMKFIIKQPPEEQKRLRTRFRDFGKVYNIPDRTWWLMVKGLRNPEAKATAYWLRYKTADAKERRKLQNYVYKIGGITSPRFYKRFFQLKRKDKGGSKP